ncbi:MAG: redox-sensing transcriptional repressor Rex [Armatimonadota bacterium]|jgi:redox-sensing transcriptional repressor
MERNPQVAEAAVYRLSRYLQCVQRLERDAANTVSSSEIGRLCGVSADQVRKDFSYFGEFGRPGVGYSVAELSQHLARILRVDRQQRIVIVGVGHLGAALAAYPGFERRGFRVVGLFDSDPDKIGAVLAGHIVGDVDELATRIDGLNANIGVIAVPRRGAQAVADRMVAAKIGCILNFAPVMLSVPDGVVVKNVDVTRELQWLAYFLPAP